MKIIIAQLVIVFALGMTSTLFAQSDDDNYGYRGICGDRAGYMSDYLNNKLSLSDQQYNDIYRTFLEHEKQRDEDFEKYSDDREAFRNASDKRRQKLDTDLKGILSSEQYTEYEQLKSQMYKKMKTKFGRHKGWGRSQGWLENLSENINLAGK